MNKKLTQKEIDELLIKIFNELDNKDLNGENQIYDISYGS